MEEDELYGLPLERFVPERDSLAKSLRAEGRRDDAGRVKRLRKPSVAAWAVNQLVRTQRGAVGELFAAGDALGQAHSAVVEGTGDGRSLRDAAGRERAAVDELVGAARGLLSSDGHDLSPTIIDRVADTLNAAALDEDARRQVRDGRLERELRHVGLGAATFAGAVPAGPRAKTSKSSSSPRQPKPDLAALRRAAKAAEADARRRADQAGRTLRGATEARDRAAERLREAQQALAQAEEALAQAEEAFAQAEEAFAQAEGEAHAAAEAHHDAVEQLGRVGS